MKKRTALVTAEKILAAIEGAVQTAGLPVGDRPLADRELVLGAIREALACGTCHNPYAVFCPSCRGRKGGKVTSPKKARSSRRAWKRHHEAHAS